MAILPPSLVDRITFLEARLTLWDNNASQIGLTPSQVRALVTAVEAARQGFNEQQAAKAAAKAATERLHNLGREMNTLASDAVRSIKHKAAQNNDPNVYVLANIPAPQPPAPPPPLEAPADLVADPNADGTVSLKWKGSVAHQTFFSVWRKLGEEGTWRNIGSTALKQFSDASMPSPAPALVLYHVRSQRLNSSSAPSVTVSVTFGAGGEPRAAVRNASPDVAGVIGGGAGGGVSEAA